MKAWRVHAWGADPNEAMTLESIPVPTPEAGEVVFDNVGEAVREISMNCIGYNGRYLIMGFAWDKRFADEKLIVPRRVLAGNMKLCGVLMAYSPRPWRAFETERPRAAS